MMGISDIQCCIFCETRVRYRHYGVIESKGETNYILPCQCDHYSIKIENTENVLRVDF